jgi:hypothetical protein
MIERNQDYIEKLIGINDVRVSVSTAKGMLFIEQRELDNNLHPTEYSFRFEFPYIESAVESFGSSSVAWGAVSNLFLSASLLSCTTGIINENFHIFTRLLCICCGYSLFRLGINTLNFAQYDIKTLSCLNKHH